MKLTFYCPLRFRHLSFLTLLFFLLFSSYSCDKTRKDAEKSFLSAYVENLNPIYGKRVEQLEDGLYLVKRGFSSPKILKTREISKGDVIEIAYKGYLLKDTSVVFRNKTIESPEQYTYKEDKVIEAWERCIPRLGIDEPAVIITSSDYAYGKEYMGSIPPYSSLIFEVRILNVKRK